MKRELEICGVNYVAYFTVNRSAKYEDALSFDFHISASGEIVTSMDDSIPPTLQDSMMRLIEANLENLAGAQFCYLVQKRVQ